MTDEKNTKSAKRLVFSGFQYDLDTGLVYDSAHKVVHMRRQSADVLAVLAQHSGEIVSKDALVAKVWPAGVATDDSLVQCVADIRRTIGKDAIETFPKKGYRLAFDESKQPYQRPGSNRKAYWLVASIIVPLLAAAFVHYKSQLSNQTELAPPVIVKENTLAVLPFTSLGDDPDLHYFADGLSVDLTTDLSKVSGLTVISHRSSADYPNAESQFRSIADDLGVRYLVRGTLRSSDDQVRINVSLIDSNDGFNVWAERYDRDKNDSFSVQVDITREIVNTLLLQLDIADVSRQRVEPDAYFMLLRGLEPLRESSLIGNAKARDNFKRALQLDPQYARAHASVAMTYARDTALKNNDKRSPTVAKGLESAITAIQLDPNIPHAYYALGLLNLAIHEYDAALGAARHSLKLDANYADGYALLAEAALYGGELSEGLQAIERAKRLHPHHTADYHWLEGHILYQLGEHKKADVVLREAFDANPENKIGVLVLAANYEQLGQVDTATELLKDVGSTINSVLDQLSFRSSRRQDKLLQGIDTLQRGG